MRNLTAAVCLFALLLVASLGCTMTGADQPNDPTNNDNQATDDQPSNDNNNDASVPDLGDRFVGDELDESPAAFTVEGNAAIMSGVIDGTTPDVLADLVNNNPDVTTIILANVPGSDDDDANIEAARFLRQTGLNTHVPTGPGVASGGTDLFLAGVRRTTAAGAVLGVHSWQDDLGSGKEQKDASPDFETDPVHVFYIDYYQEMGINDPAGFYCFTLDVAPPDDIYNMTADEMNTYGMCSPDPCP